VSEQVEEQGRAQAPLLDLFATAVHRFGSAWADLVAASLTMLVLGSLPIALADAAGASTAGTFAVALIAYTAAFHLLLGFVVLRGLPSPPGRSRWLATACSGLLTGLLAGVLAVVLFPFLGLIAMPLSAWLRSSRSRSGFRFGVPAAKSTVTSASR